MVEQQHGFLDQCSVLRDTNRRDNNYATLNSKSRPNPLSVGSLSTTAAQERLYIVFAMTMLVCVFVFVKFSYKRT